MNTLKLLNSVHNPSEYGQDAQGQMTFKVGNQKSQPEIDATALKIMVSLLVDLLPPESAETIRQQFRHEVAQSGLRILE